MEMTIDDDDKSLKFNHHKYIQQITFTIGLFLILLQSIGFNSHEISGDFS